MAFPRNSIRNFLVHAKSALRTAISENQKVTFVVGNESADLDSLVCGIVYAYIRSQKPPANAFTPLYIPLSNIPAADVQLRPELLALLPHANLQPSHLVTLDDLPPLDRIGEELRRENTKWILVDHNALQGTLGKVYGERVSGVIDHHDEENKVPKETGDEPRIITKTGSCASLVTDYCRPSWDTISSGALSSGAAHGQADDQGIANDASQVKLWDAQAAKLALAPLLIDTNNLTAKKKTTDHDLEAAAYLGAKIMLCPKTSIDFDKDKFFAEIDGAKRDIGRLTLSEILRKDYKQWEENGFKLGISSVVKSLEFLQDKAKQEESGDQPFFEAVERFAKERSLDMYATMTAYPSPEGEFRRQLFLWALSDRAMGPAERFVASASKDLDLEELEEQMHVTESGNGWKKVWRQKNVGASRKQVGPLLRQNMR
ncbi:uncharacterized protein K452DRAFT_310049 [Aplosporella prunicola CBS 121167]|uniref:DHHA2 domain-containing protein n=1 Tax=Aplosporella prunicola CBS 121167 TaxID=1176127 RepID=A0A6A6B865_9PEZI|nr:uncharacterized protein K452DRAFT_310049 [Aplosporella prunicola CBS 121167]KAF2140290.1 hypothetical protein K452DRAFT_310049 [Aplosporella prunicola CBS 121167]